VNPLSIIGKALKMDLDLSVKIITYCSFKLLLLVMACDVVGKHHCCVHEITLLLANNCSGFWSSTAVYGGH